ncbi:MAG: universal stress protein [Actinomycetes bacterium]
MYRTIIVGTDGSETAQEAVRRAVGLARLTGGSLHVVTAYGATTPVAALAGAAGYATEALSMPQQRVAAEGLLDQALTGLETDGVAITAHARQGDAADVLIAAASELSADLIVVGNRGMTGARRFFLGSVPNRVAHHADCAVHIVHTC